MFFFSSSKIAMGMPFDEQLFAKCFFFFFFCYSMLFVVFILLWPILLATDGIYVGNRECLFDESSFVERGPAHLLYKLNI